MDYQATVDWLFQQFPAYQKIGAKAYKPDLYNVEKLCNAFNNPQQNTKFIHIAGTNGKGSTSSFIASILTENGYKTGLFTSPHIKNFTERIRVNGYEANQEFVTSFVRKVQGLKLDYQPSFFEITFVMALVYFRDQKVDFAVIETGLGGRLDATNIISPILSVITNIGLEHTNFLGDTLELIAAEKAGIIKQNTPVVIGEFDSKTYPVFQTKAQQEKANLILAPQNYTKRFTDIILGEYLQKNLNTALVACEVLQACSFISNYEQKIHAGLVNIEKNTGFKGRLQIINQSPLTIIDCAHNTDGIKALLSSLKEIINNRKLHIVYGTSNDKNLNDIFKLFPKSAQYYLSEFTNNRSATITKLSEEAELNNLNFSAYTQSAEAYAYAKTHSNQEDLILIFGSFFLISEFYS